MRKVDAKLEELHEEFFGTRKPVAMPVPARVMLAGAAMALPLAAFWLGMIAGTARAALTRKGA